MNEQVDMKGDEAISGTLAAVEAFAEAYKRADIDDTMKLMTTDCVFETSFPQPDGQRSVGQNEVRAAFLKLFATGGVPGGGRTETEELAAAGDRVILRWAQYKSGATGEARTLRAVDIFRVRDGKVAEKLTYAKRNL